MLTKDPSPDYLIELLCLWWRVESQFSAVEGYPNECPSTLGYRASRQYDDQNCAFETDDRGRLARSIGYIVNAIPEPYRTALYMLARNRVTGARVWTSVRLPSDEDKRRAVVSHALELFGNEV